MNSNQKKKVVQSVAVATMMITLTGTCLSYTQPTMSVEVQSGCTAGIATTLHDMNAQAFSGTLTVEQSNTTVVAAVEETSPWTNKLMAQVDEFLYVRESANPEGNVVGKLYKGNLAEILSVEGDWIQITSGNVTGYVSAEYCVIGEDAGALANQICKTYGKVLADGLRVREEANESADVLKGLDLGQRLEVATDVVPVEGWTAVRLGSTVGYVSSEYLEVAMDFGSAETIEEEQARLAAEAEARRQAEAKKAAQRTQHAAVAAGVDDVTLLAALIQCEAGAESYEGKLAVGAVVMNRMRSGSYPSSLHGVIYQSGQFGPASSGKLASVLASGPNGSCVSAAQEALSGVDNTGGATSFKNSRSGHPGVVIGCHVFF